MKQLKKHELNFYTRFTAKAEKKKANYQKLIKASPFIVVAIAAAALTLYFQLQINNYKDMIAAEEVIFQDENNISSAREVDLFDGKSAMYSSEADALRAFDIVCSSYPTYGTEELTRIFDCAEECGVDILSISVSPVSGITELMASAPTESLVPAFIRELKATELFVNVYYEGYSDNGGEGEHSYTFSVEMKRKAVLDPSELEEYSYDGGYYYGEYSYDSSEE